MDAKIFRVNYKSDFILTLTSDAGWLVPFCIKFWTGSPMLAYYASYDGETYTHCTYDPAEPTKLTVQFDDHHLPVGDLKYQVAYHFTVADFPENTEDEVTNQANVTTVINGETYQVMLDLNGETAPEIQFALPAYANELQRIQNEQTRIAQEQQRVSQEQTRINQEAARVTEFNGIKAEALSDHQRANQDHSRALSDHQNALDDRSQAASDHSRAQSDHNTATSDHLQANSDHSRAQSDHNTAISDHQTALSDHTQANYDHTRAESDHSRATSDSSTAANDHRIAADDHTQANTDHNRAENDHQRVETDLAEVEEFSNSLGPYDISAAHATGSTLATYPNLATAIGTNGTNIPEALRKGGMSVKFVQSSDNNPSKYVQYRLMADAFSTDTNDWSFCGDDVYVESPEFVKAVTDAEGRILYGIKTNGDFVFGVGVPQSIKDYVLSQKALVDADVLAEKTRAMAAEATKVDKIPGKGLSTNDYTDDERDIVNISELTTNPEYLQAITDSEGRIIEGINFKGDKEIHTIVDLDGIKIASDSNVEWSKVITDENGRILWGIKADGTVYDSTADKRFKEFDDNIQSYDSRIDALEDIQDIAHDKDTVELAFIDLSYAALCEHLKTGDWGIAYSKPMSLVYKAGDDEFIKINDFTTIASKRYHYGNVYIKAIKDSGYDYQYYLLEYKHTAKSCNGAECLHIPYLDTLPDYSDETWDFSKHVGTTNIYTIMQQTYDYMDALLEEFPNLITKYDPMASESYTDNGIVVQTLPSIKTYMANHGYDAYPFWYNGCEEGDYTITVGDNTYEAHLKATSAFRTFVYKISQPAWYSLKANNRASVRRKIYVQSGIHGAENLGPVTAAHIMKELLSGSEAATTILGNYDIYIIPVIDGYNSLHGDYNGAYGTNGNRNFPTPWWRDDVDNGNHNWGKAAGDYFVTRLACAFIDMMKPDVAFDIHGGGNHTIPTLGYFETSLHYTAAEMYQANMASMGVMCRTAKLETFFGTRHKIPIYKNNNEIACNAYTHDYFFYKGIRCNGLVELADCINWMATEDGDCVNVRTSENDFIEETWEIASLLMMNHLYCMCQYNLNKF